VASAARWTARPSGTASGVGPSLPGF